MSPPMPTDSTLRNSTPAALTLQGRIKSLPEDFVVEEIPAYELSGSGEHRFLWIQKRDVSAEQLLQHIASMLRIRREEIGVAGLKDRWAVTRQWISVPATASPDPSLLNTDQIEVLESRLHGNKLRTGHLRGNRFGILIRPAAGLRFEVSHLEIAQQVIAHMRTSGIPNYFGDQRFGTTGETLELGLSLLRGEESPRRIPFHRRKFLTRLALSAAQSQLFNGLLTSRIDDGLARVVLAGDVMQVTATGGLFVVDDVEREQQRCDQQETVLTGPIFGPKMKSPTGEVLEREQSALQQAGLKMAHFQAHAKFTSGTRRPYFVWPSELTATLEEEGIRVAFSLPSGSYATVVLREFLKESTVTEPDDDTP
ncbi:tRNA pseudouridine(13) synthase TruD [Planctomicrobium sp. SH664]|uniref:tRNA pseudouridine(13) synthase TruD n=1 Tax=Planctomicrobium sp. SH664 TaxID=3448125 RepID=UPI003F5B66DD